MTIGFMQGRLSPKVNGKIQAFPWSHWRDEFKVAHENGFELMEWTLDQEGLYENPLLEKSGQKEIRLLQEKCALKIESLTGDCFMQAPFYKGRGKLDDARAIVKACSEIGIKYIVLPLVDDGRLENLEQEKEFFAGMQDLRPLVKESHLKIIFESDLPPQELATFMERLDPTCFGINYDMGNSASLGFDCEQELSAYFPRIDNVHVKDRMLFGTTVALGTGNCQFEKVFSGLANYKGNFILQTARAQNDQEHLTDLLRYKKMVEQWICTYLKK